MIEDSAESRRIAAEYNRPEAKYSVGQVITVQPGKWANNRQPVKAKVLSRWFGEDGVWVYNVETTTEGKRGNFDELHVLG